MRDDGGDGANSREALCFCKLLAEKIELLLSCGKLLCDRLLQRRKLRLCFTHSCALSDSGDDILQRIGRCVIGRRFDEADDDFTRLRRWWSIDGREADGAICCEGEKDGGGFAITGAEGGEIKLLSYWCAA